MHQVVCATTNPAKIQAILQAFHEIFGEGSCHIASVAVESGVPEQPFGSEETRAGARNRVANARRLLPEADFWVAIEAGIDGDSTFSWVVIENASQRGEARSATLPLPAVILEKVREGEALGPELPEAVCGFRRPGRADQPLTAVVRCYGQTEQEAHALHHLRCVPARQCIPSDG